MKRYRLAKFKDRNIIAFTEDSKVIKSALNRYQPDTAKRAMFCCWLRIATLLRLPSVWKRVTEEQIADILGFNLDQWLKSIKNKFNGPSIIPVIIWPPEASRRRIYIHLLNTNGDVLGFAKIAFDSNNSKLQNECKALQGMAKHELQEFHVPSVIDKGMFDSNNYLIVESLPESVKTHRKSNIGFPSEAVKELSGEIKDSSFGQIKESDWYRSFHQSLDSKSYFMTELSRFADNEIVKLCRIHGDFGPSNLLQVNERLWIIDWEESCDNGPYLTDYISFFLGTNRKQVLRKPEKMLKQLMVKFLSYPYYAKSVDIMMALAYLYNADFALADKMIDIRPKKGNVEFDIAN